MAIPLVRRLSDTVISTQETPSIDTSHEQSQEIHEQINNMVTFAPSISDKSGAGTVQPTGDASSTADGI